MELILKRLLTFIAIITLAGCATLNPNFEKPQVSVNSFKVVPGGGLNPSFEIGLKVTNPNSTELNIKGMSYAASIDGNQIFTGVANQIPVVPAYGEEDVKLIAQADLFGGVRLLTDLMKTRESSLKYTLNIKLDVGTFALPIRITREGNLTMPSAN